MMKKFKYEQLKAFFQETDGAVTVDFVILTAGVVTLGTAATVVLGPKVTAFLATITL
jgi:hypothetical protein